VWWQQSVLFFLFIIISIKRYWRIIFEDRKSSLIIFSLPSSFRNPCQSKYCSIISDDNQYVLLPCLGEAISNKPTVIWICIKKFTLEPKTKTATRSGYSKHYMYVCVIHYWMYIVSSICLEWKQLIRPNKNMFHSLFPVTSGQ
jgi:hypothetical protein